MQDYTLSYRKGEVDVCETRTEQVIGTYKFAADARSALRHLRTGVGFNGWTPAFFLQNAPSIPQPRAKV